MLNRPPPPQYAAVKQQAFNEQTREHMAELATKHAKHSAKVVTIIALILGFFLLLSMGVNELCFREVKAFVLGK